MKIRQCVPAPVKRVIKDVYHRYLLGRAVRDIAAHPDRVPSPDILSQLSIGWGNEGYAATTDYLQAVSAAVLKAEGPILECGSGISSILMNLLGASRHIPVWSLEHFQDWHTHVSASLKRYGLNAAQMMMAPLKGFNGYSWYDAPIPQMPENFSLVICDGPPGDTPGGRYGLLPRYAPILAKGATIFLDDADRPKEQEALDRWKKEFNVSVEMKNSDACCYAVVRMPN